jgi:hypothetical protein
VAPRETVQPTINDHGDEVHPAFGMIQATRVSHSHGAVLFDSDITHHSTVRISVSTASRKRDLHRDWIHGGSKQLVEVEMSEAQWASFVSSMGTAGVPCTIRATQSEWRIPELPYDPRLAHSMAEVKDAAERLFAGAKEALAEYERALSEKSPAKIRNAALGKLRAAVGNAESNISFAAESLSEHAENVVQRARADIEAMVAQKAAALDLPAGESRGMLELPEMPREG